MRRRAFTLFEVIIAIALIAMLAGSVFSFLWTLIGRRDLLHRRSVETQATGALIERIEADVLAGLAGGGSAGAGVTGTATSLKLLTRGVWLPTGQTDRGDAARDLQASEYTFDAAAGVLRGRRWAVVGAGGATPEFEIISEHVQRLRLRYFDGEQWGDSFDSVAKGLPVAIEIAVWFGDPLPAADVGGATTAPAAHESEGPAESRNDSGVSIAATRTGGAGRSASSAVPTREPDRLRVIVVPDGPVAPWKESR